MVEESNELLHLETTEGAIDATTNHPFYVTGRGWVAAGDLVVGNEIHTLDGDTGRVTGFKLEKLDKPIPVYNLEVEDFNSYYVGDGVLVHNGCKKLSTERANQVAQSFGYSGAEDFKQAFTNKGGWYNMMIDEHTKEIILERIRNTADHILTGLFYK